MIVKTIVLERRPGMIKMAHLDNDGTITTQTIADAEPVLERNKRMQNDRKSHQDWECAYGIPNGFIYKWLHEDGVNILKLPKDELMKYLRKKVGVNPDYKYLRTSGGRY